MPFHFPFITVYEVINFIKVNETKRSIYYYLKDADLYLFRYYNDVEVSNPISFRVNEQPEEEFKSEEIYKCQIYGPTCTSCDIITDKGGM